MYIMEAFIFEHYLNLVSLCLFDTHIEVSRNGVGPSWYQWCHALRGHGQALADPQEDPHGERPLSSGGGMLTLRSFHYLFAFFLGGGGEGNLVEISITLLLHVLHFLHLLVVKYKLLGWSSWLAGCISELWRRGRWPTFIFTQR